MTSLLNKNITCEMTSSNTKRIKSGRLKISCLRKNYMQQNISQLRGPNGGYYTDLLSSEMLGCIVWCTNIDILEETEDQGSRLLSVSTYTYQATQVSHPRRQ